MARSGTSSCSSAPARARTRSARRTCSHADNYDFLPILADDGHWLIFRRKNRLTPDYRTIKKEVWGPAEPKLKFGRRCAVLDTFEEIRDATAAGAAAGLAHGAGRRADRPAGRSSKRRSRRSTSSPKRSCTRSTPARSACPTSRRRHEPPIDCLRLAFVAFNAPHFADFVVEQPTPIVEDGQERLPGVSLRQPDQPAGEECA